MNIDSLFLLKLYGYTNLFCETTVDGLLKTLFICLDGTGILFTAEDPNTTRFVRTNILHILYVHSQRKDVGNWEMVL